MKIALITDAWKPQINGVVTTLINTIETLERLGHEVKLLSPDLFSTWPCPGYPDVGLAFLCGPKLRPILKAFKPDAIHFVTEGPVGYAARRYCRHMGYHFTSSYLSQFPDYLKLRIGFPTSISSLYLRWFHRRSERVLVATDSLHQKLSSKGYQKLAFWSRGVDTELYRPRSKEYIKDQRPIFLFVGRVAIEKNIEAFLKLDLPGTKYVIGDGPQRETLQLAYTNVRFIGYRTGEDLARYIAAADVFVFPSLTDTFGVVMLEALASGVPVAAFPVMGPKDIINDDRIGVLSNDLKQASLKALTLSSDDCRRHALEYSWGKSTRQFVSQLTPLQKP